VEVVATDCAVSSEERAELPRCSPTVTEPLALDAGSPAPGDALSRRFRVDRVIAMGGMGIVIAAHHLALDTRVAIKLMRPELRARKDLVRRFLREGRAAARLHSRHVARVFDVATLDDGAPYIVMEYLDGIDLAAWLVQRGAAPVSLAAAIIVQASDAIAEAHAAGIIHRDLKPSNLFLTQDRGELLAKVLDLGICKLLAPVDDLRDTSAGSGALGTPLYMAPEQLAAARRADARSDIWSLGVILYELVTGRVPFPGRTVAEVRERTTQDPGPPSCAGVPEAFEAIIRRCLAKDPAQRFQRVGDLVAALAPFAGGMRSGGTATVAIRHRARGWHTRTIVAAVAVAAIAGASGALALGWPAPGEPAAAIRLPELAAPAPGSPVLALPVISPPVARAPSLDGGPVTQPAPPPLPPRKRAGGQRPAAPRPVAAASEASTPRPLQPAASPPVASPAADDPLANPD
jgi:serine/threonine-protein kinase